MNKEEALGALRLEASIVPGVSYFDLTCRSRRRISKARRPLSKHVGCTFWKFSKGGEG